MATLLKWIKKHPVLSGSLYIFMVAIFAETAN